METIFEACMRISYLFTQVKAEAQQVKQVKIEEPVPMLLGSFKTFYMVIMLEELQVIF